MSESEVSGKSVLSGLPNYRVLFREENGFGFRDRVVEFCAPYDAMAIEQARILSSGSTFDLEAFRPVDVPSGELEEEQ